MKRILALPASFAMFLAASTALPEPLPVTGHWRILDEDDGSERSVVQIYEQRGRVFGKIVSGKGSIDANGKPKLCTRCEGADKNRPFIGLVIIKNLTPDGDEYTGGTIMDPTDGTIYRCELQAIDGGKRLKVRGFVGISLLGRTQTWVKK